MTDGASPGVLGALAPMLRELREVRDLPDDDPRRQAALEKKRRMLDIVEHYEGCKVPKA